MGAISKASRGATAALNIVALITPAAVLAQSENVEPLWAYSLDPPAIEGSKIFELPGAVSPFTFDQIRNVFGPADWYPGDHPPMPDIVAHGRFPDVWACGLCHYPNGKGRPENAGVAGLPKEYFLRQLADFRGGRRTSAEPRKANTSRMITIAQGLTADEMNAAAEYYGSMSWTPWIRVVEAEKVPKARIVGGMYIPYEGRAAGTEALGLRIVETPEDPERTEVMRDPHSGFIAYVPVGAVARGKALAMTNGGKTIVCAICHGEGLNGLGAVPPLAGRSPSYLVRQLYDIREGARRGIGAELMKPVVAPLTVADMIDLAAYAASLPPASSQ